MSSRRRYDVATTLSLYSAIVTLTATVFGKVTREWFVGTAQHRADESLAVHPKALLPKTATVVSSEFILTPAGRTERHAWIVAVKLSLERLSVVLYLTLRIHLYASFYISFVLLFILLHGSRKSKLINK